MFLWKTRLKNPTSLLNCIQKYSTISGEESLPYSQSRVHKDRRVRIYIEAFYFFFYISNDRNKFFLLLVFLLNTVYQLIQPNFFEKPYEKNFISTIY